MIRPSAAAERTMVPATHVLAVVRSAAVEQALGAARVALPDVVLSQRAVPLSDLYPSADLLQAPDVLLLELDTDDARDFEALERITRRHFPGVPVLVVAAAAAIPVIRRMMRLGVTDILPQPPSPDDLREALAHTASTRAANAGLRPRGKVLAFLKAGGGVGATTLATQAAIAFASRGKAEPGGVCLMDLDVQYGAAALYLDLDDRMGLADLLDDPQRLDAELLRSVMVHHRSGLHLLAPPREVLGLDAVTPDFIEALVALARADYETLLLDLPSVWTPWSYRAVQCCDAALLVTQLGVAGIRQARRQLDAMAANGLGNVAVRIVVNRLEPRWRRQVSLKEAERALGRPIDAMIANDYGSVSAAIERGIAVAEIRRRSKVVHDIRRMIESAVAGVADADADADADAGAGTVRAMPRRLVARRI